MKTRGSVERVMEIYADLPDETRGEGAQARSPRQLVHDCVLNHFFASLVDMSGMRKGKELMLALVSYWWDFTHTFHFRWGEATITPVDYTCITGLAFH